MNFITIYQLFQIYFHMLRMIEVRGGEGVGVMEVKGGCWASSVGAKRCYLISMDLVTIQACI